MDIFGLSKAARNFETALDFNDDVIRSLRVARFAMNQLALVPNKKDRFEGRLPLEINRPLDRVNRIMLDSLYDIHGQAFVLNEESRDGKLSTVTRMVGTRSPLTQNNNLVIVNEIFDREHGTFKAIASAI